MKPKKQTTSKKTTVKQTEFKNPLPGLPLIESPFFNKYFNENTDKEIFNIATQLKDNGFAIFKFPDKKFNEKAESIKTELYSHYDFDAHKLNPKTGLRVQDAWKFNDDVKSLATNNRILDILEQMYGRKPIPFQTLNFPVGTQQHYHSDAIHFSSIPERFMCGVWVALEDVEEEAGPLEYYAGSHKWPIFTNEHIGRSHSPNEKVSQVVFHDLWESLVETTKVEKQTFKAKKGDTLIWCANLLHGGAPHLDLDKTRWSQVTHYYFEDCVYYTPMLSETYKGVIHYRDITNILTGEKVLNMSNGHAVDTTFIEQAKAGFDFGKIIPINEFDTERYLKDNPDVESTGAEPYEHYRRHGIIEGRKAFPISARKDPLPQAIFDKKAYLAANKDVADSGVDAYEHYIKHGLDENRPLTV